MSRMYTAQQRKRIAQEAVGLTIASLTWDEDDHYWTATFTDGSEFSFRFMAELVAGDGVTDDTAALRATLRHGGVLPGGQTS